MNELGYTLIHNLRADMCEYVGIKDDFQMFKHYCMGCTDKLAEQWRLIDPTDEIQVRNYYRQDWEWYIGDLVWWHTQVEGRIEWFHRNLRVMREQGVWTVLDYGAGICSDGLILAANGLDVTCVDFASPALQFAKWRAKKYGIDTKIVTFDEFSHITMQAECIMCLDVLEHMKHSRGLLEMFTRKAWLLCISAVYKKETSSDWWHPQHFPEEAGASWKEILFKAGFYPFEENFWIHRGVLPKGL